MIDPSPHRAGDTVASTLAGPCWALAVCVDANLIWQAVFFLQRSRANDPAGRLAHYLYCSDPVAPVYRDILGPDVTIVEVADDSPGFADVGYLPYVTAATMLRFKALQDLTQRYDRVVYSDVDIYQRRGSFLELDGLAWGDLAVAGVRDVSGWAGSRHARTADRKVLPAHARDKYLNAGVLVVHSANFRSRDIANRCLSFIAANPEDCALADQTALNCVLDGAWLELSPSWNWQTAKGHGALCKTRNPRFVHFTGPRKPWADKTRLHDEIYATAMAEFLRAHALSEPLAALEAALAVGGREKRLVEKQADPDGKLAKLLADGTAYFDRSDFADIAAGVAPYGDTIGGLPTPPGPAGPEPAPAAISIHDQNKGAPRMTLTQLAAKYDSDKGFVKEAHGYTWLYDMLFFPYRNQPVRLLEMGLQIGGPEQGHSPDRETTALPSVSMWLEFFESAHITGLDISDFSWFENENFQFVRCDMDARENIAKAAEAFAAPFDIIIDDASHASPHQHFGLLETWRFLKPGGLYIIEDLHWQPRRFERKGFPKTANMIKEFQETRSFKHGHPEIQDDLNAIAPEIGFAYTFPERFRPEGRPKVAVLQKTF
ncbi:hypothetical protein roselon_03242 [Roseibacterium elongatum DSM 19469]|uniref:Uncharacterized protein n=1 Tax=Roseicyclus elongatus DSM 19469 TaxID=1294273 RepID=W8SSL8_9RHOB|nr:glycosyltransferase [Roseibacterium elongatum]AHM05505.1 hypothetical protein roselon_03242 [Roseibacterium elongatum DSM 19469]